MRGHKWGKNIGMIQYRIQAFTQINDTIVDFFCGGAAIIAGTKMLNRRWLAFEIDPDTADTARRRVRETQPPLFVPQPQQMEMEI
jgi:DNA modification methylase